MGRVACVSLAILLINAVSSQDTGITFSDQGSGEGGDVNPKLGGGDDVQTRFFGLDLNTFAGQVAASAVGTVVGNAGTNLAGNYLSGCNNRGKRSVLMHKIEKRQALDANAKSGNAGADPEVNNRLFCPQDFLNPGGSSGGSSYCDRCNCRDWQCNRDCRKCGNNGNTGWSSNTGFNNNNAGCRHSGGCSNNNNNYVSCSSCSCSYSSSCRNTCSKCRNNNNNNYVRCSSCSCYSSSSCRNTCSKCRNNNNNNYNNYGNSWSSGSSYNSGYRNSGIRGRAGEDSEETPHAVTASDAVSNINNEGESVVFGDK